MSVHIKFTGGDPLEYEYVDSAGLEYRYAIADNGTLEVYEKPADGHLDRDADPVAVYGVAGWRSVSSDPKKKGDLPPARMRSF